MKATSFDGKQMTYDENYPDPKPGESLVRVSLAGICGTDLEILDGYMAYNGVLGHEFVGVVEKSQNPDLVGKRVVGEINAGCSKCDSCKKGMQRHCPSRTVLGILKRDGAFAEFLSLPEENLHVIPDSISDEQAVFVEPLAAAFEIKEQISLNSDWKVAVVGDGRLAQMICQVLKLSCPDVTCFGRHQSKLANLEKFEIPTKIWNKMSPAELWAANKKFLDRTISRGDDILLSNPVKNLDEVDGYFRRELDYLINQGYRLTNDGGRLVR